MKMKELEARTGVGRETIRVYIRFGIIPEPVRPKRNVADYGQEHVRAILAVRELQRESRLTLTQIAEIVQGRTTEQRIEPAAFQHLEELVATGVGVDNSLVAISTLIEENPHALDDARAFHRVGAAEVIQDDDEPKLSLTDARLVTIWGQMRRAGFVESANFPPEIVRFYVEAAQYVAGNEATKFLERSEGRISEEDAAAMCDVALPRMLDLFGLMRLKFFLRNIHHARTTGTVPPPRLPSRSGDSSSLETIDAEATRGTKTRTEIADARLREAPAHRRAR
ncbi:MAG: merR regulatory family protein [Alphaproteobacteria bacterium]|nr:merR regulatory family protein [Alphaproteobacteria bacterium]